MPVVLLLIAVPLLISLVDFIGFLVKGRRIVNVGFAGLAELGAFIILPYIYVSLASTNDCCGDSAAFSPAHRMNVYVLIVLCIAAYFYATYRQQFGPPLLEVLVNVLLIVCIVLNIFIAIQTKELFFALLGNLPVILMTIVTLARNQKAFLQETEEMRQQPGKGLERAAWRLLTMAPIGRYPVLLVLALPVLVVLSAVLLLFGQKPDSLIRAFTDTYWHGFSQWNHQCDNVACGGHYLCSVAANGHPAVVKPQRRGVRNGGSIVCNRQLLVSNAFEDLIQERLPSLHKIIRRSYDRVGNVVHRYYGVFSNRYFADIIYLLMKPAEWVFVVILYVFDRKPENRIAKQYLSRQDRVAIDALACNTQRTV